MKKKHKFEYFLTRIVGVIAKALPLNTALHIGDLIGDLFFYIIKTRKDVARNNLKTILGNEKSDAELKLILHKNYRHFGRVMMEFARLPLYTNYSILNQIPVHNKEYLDEIMQQGRGVIILSAHIGNWEYLAAAMAKLYPPLHCVFKQQKNLAVDRTIKQIRTDIGLVPLKVKGGAARGVISALKKKEMALIVMDQDAGKKGRFIDFLGRLASTTDGPAAIAIRHRIPVIMAFGIRGKNGQIQIRLQFLVGISRWEQIFCSFSQHPPEGHFCIG